MSGGTVFTIVNNVWGNNFWGGQYSLFYWSVKAGPHYNFLPIMAGSHCIIRSGKAGPHRHFGIPHFPVHQGKALHCDYLSIMAIWSTMKGPHCIKWPVMAEAALLNHKEYAWHSFRIGAATTAGTCGLNDSSIQMLGRWSSSAYQVYIKTPRQQLANLSAVLGQHSNL